MHWNSIDIFDYGRADDGTFYYVMECLPGMNLSELVRRYGPMPAARTIHLIRQACDALQEARRGPRASRHQAGQHLRRRAGRPVRHSQAARFPAWPSRSPTSRGPDHAGGTITGSPLYMSPEQAIGDHEPDARSDIYAMGACSISASPVPAV